MTWLSPKTMRALNVQGENPRSILGRSFPVRWVAALFGIVVLLSIIAVLQYRWNDQIRKATEARMGAELESSMINWHLDLYGEFSAICVALQVGPDSGARDRWDDYLQRYKDWRQASTPGLIENIYTNRDLVKNVYVWETGRAGNAQLLRFDPDAERIQPSAVPRELQTLLAYLQQNSTNLPTALRAWEARNASEGGRPAGEQQLSPGHRLRSNAITGWQFDPAVPAIVHPILGRAQYRSAASKIPASPVDWIVVVLSMETIQSRILPELTQRYFGAGQDYDVAVMEAGKMPRLLFSSDPDFLVRDTSRSDSVMNMFGPPPESAKSHSWQTFKNIQSVRAEDWRSFSAPVWFPIIQHRSSVGPWMLFLKHRNTPLETKVTRVWRSNLVLGGIALLLLAISIVLVVIAGQQAQALARLQMYFVAAISHELRTPLTTILSAGQNITDGLAVNLPLYSSIITGQALQLIDLVDQILFFAAISAGKGQYLLRPLEISELLEDVRKKSLWMAERQGFVIDFQVHEDLPCVWGDMAALSRCLHNLIGNAMKYSRENKWVGVDAMLDKSAPSRTEIAISITDHGIGISPSELKDIFEPFYRSPGVLAAQIHGSGLGLAVARQVANAMGGRISVVSEVGVGSVFTLHLRTADKLNPQTMDEMQRVLESS